MSKKELESSHSNNKMSKNKKRDNQGFRHSSELHF
jgi:hypothetical protein